MAPRFLWLALICGLTGPVLAQSAPPVADEAVAHSQGLPMFLQRMQPWEFEAMASGGGEITLGGPAADALDDHRRLSAAIAALAPQRPGTIDAYLVIAALDSDPVFGREARAAGAVLSRRYDAAGRTIVLAAPDGRSGAPLPVGSLESLSVALAAAAEAMDPAEDALILYLAGHGSPGSVVYHYGDTGFGGMSPSRLADLLDELGIDRRVLIVNACFAGSFVTGLAEPDTVVIGAAAADRTSFGCAPGNDWTYFGDALVNRALRRPQGIAEAFEEARQKVAGWEADRGLTASDPKISIGPAAAAWLAQLERRIPREATRPVGEPAVARE